MILSMMPLGFRTRGKIRTMLRDLEVFFSAKQQAYYEVFNLPGSP